MDQYARFYPFLNQFALSGPLTPERQGTTHLLTEPT